MPSSARSSSSLSRRFIDFKHKSLGRQPLKYRFELVPECAESVPAGTTQVLVQWKRGLKLAETDLAEVDPCNRTASWNYKLLQVATIYKQDKAFLPKEYTFKLQTVEHRHGETCRVTVGKAQVDLAQFCGLDPMYIHELELPLSPAGRLRIKVSAQWLRNFDPEEDGYTDISFMSAVSDEQDLDGFDTKENVAEGLPGSRADVAGLQQSASLTEHSNRLKPLTRACTQPPESFQSILDDVSNNYQEEGKKRSSMTAIASSNNSLKSSSTIGSGKGGSHRNMLSMRLRVNGGGGEGCSGQQEEQRQQQQQQARPSSRTDSNGKEAVRVQAHHEQTPTPRSSGSTPRHQKSRSDGDIRFQLENSPATASPLDTEHYLRALASSDDEDSTPAWGGKLRTWLTGNKPPRGASSWKTTGGSKLPASRLQHGPTPCPISIDAVKAESSAEGLRSLAIRIIDEYDAVAHQRFKLESRACKLRTKLEASDKQRMALLERLTQKEGSKSPSHDITAELVASKIQLAEAEFSVLELKGQLQRERQRSHKLMAKLTKLDARYHVEKNCSGFWDSPCSTPTAAAPHPLSLHMRK